MTTIDTRHRTFKTLFFLFSASTVCNRLGFLLLWQHKPCAMDEWSGAIEKKNLEFRQKAVTGFNFEADCQSGLLAEWLDGWLLDYTMFGGSITHVWAASSVEMFQLLQLQ